jgi:hypothetical protein
MEYEQEIVLTRISENLSEIIGVATLNMTAS